MMPYIRKVTMGADWRSCSPSREASARADDWYREHGLASYYGRGLHGRSEPMVTDSLKMR